MELEVRHVLEVLETCFDPEMAWAEEAAAEQEALHALENFGQ